MARRYRQQPGVVLRRIAGETLLVPTTGELARLQCIFVLDAVGELVWGLLDGDHDVTRIVSLITREFDVSADQARADVDEYLGQLIDAGLAIDDNPDSGPETDDPDVRTDHS